jgi:hypothetical protein
MFYLYSTFQSLSEASSGTILQDCVTFTGDSDSIEQFPCADRDVNLIQILIENAAFVSFELFVNCSDVFVQT